MKSKIITKITRDNIEHLHFLSAITEGSITSIAWIKKHNNQLDILINREKKENKEFINIVNTSDENIKKQIRCNSIISIYNLLDYGFYFKNTLKASEIKTDFKILLAIICIKEINEQNNIGKTSEHDNHFILQLFFSDNTVCKIHVSDIKVKLFNISNDWVSNFELTYDFQQDENNLYDKYMKHFN